MVGPERAEHQESQLRRALPDRLCRTASAGVAELTEYRAGLSTEAEIITERAASEWRPGIGMLIDRFGVTWVLEVAA
ncbi:hypothetical protein [Leucobacter luti]|uniref:hypothetical protein n=1 Tax=Leucobacter luti TaxID=340320 RepID=UPI0010619396|nr:hypothetical protein [Leucobacter luti]